MDRWMKVKNTNISILFFTLVVIMMGFGMIIPIMPFYVKHLGASGSALGLLMATYGVMQFIFAPFWGQLSDRYGRKKILMLGVLGNAATQVLFGLSTQLWMLFAARILSGLLSSATLPTAMAYISDSTTREQRGGGMGIVGAAFGIGMVLGPGLGGWLASESLPLPFFVAGGLSMIAFILIATILPESLPEEKRSISAGKFHGPQIGLMWTSLLGPLGFLLFMAFLLAFGLTNFEAIFGLYSADRYSYTPRLVGILFMVIGITSAVVQGVFTGPLTRRWGEARIIRGSLIASAAGFFILTQVNTLPAVIAAVCFFVVSHSMLNPATSSLISKRTEGRQGLVMGLNNSYQSLGRILGPVWAGLVYDLNMNFPYWSGALVLLLGFGLSLLLLTQEPRPEGLGIAD
jgi:MFS transporter, DHA1 family, multidrug resistance protein